MLILISNNFHLWIEELKDLALKIKVWEYIDPYDKTEEPREGILPEVDHFAVKQSDPTPSAAAGDLITGQASQYRAAISQWITYLPQRW